MKGVLYRYEILEKIIEKYPNRKPNIKIIHHKENKGLGWARNTGLKQATGEYIIHIDSDDWCELDMISSLYNKATETDADIVACDYFINYENNQIYKKQNYTENVEKDSWNLWIGVLRPFCINKLIKKKIYVDNSIYPPAEISIIEDFWLMSRLFSVSKSIAYVSKALYHYWQKNTYSLTANFNEKSFKDMCWCFKSTEQFLKEKDLYQKYKEAFNTKKLNYILWLNNGKYERKLVNAICPESNKLKYIWKQPMVIMNFKTKFIYSFYFVYLGFVADILFRVKRIIKSVKR